MRPAGSLDISESIKKAKEEEKAKEQVEEPKYVTHDPGAKPWMLNALLAFSLLVFLVIALQPQYLGALEGRAYDRYWDSVQQDIQQRVWVQYEQLPQAERMRLAQNEYIEARNDPQYQADYESELENVRNVYKDEREVLYPYSGFNQLQEAREGGGLSYFSMFARFFTSHFERGLSYYPIVLGLLGIILVFVISRQFNIYAGPVGAFTLAMQPAYVSEMHYGNIGFDLTGVGIGVGIALLCAFIFSRLLPLLTKVVDGLHFGITRLRLGAVILVMLLVFTTYVDEAWSTRELTPPVDDSVIAVSQFISTTIPENEKLLVWTHWEDIYEYYSGRKGSGMSEREIGKAFLADGECSDCKYVIVSEDYIGRATAMAKAAGIDNNVSASSISPCVEVKDAILCAGNFIVRDGEVKQKDQHPAAFYNYLENGTVTEYADSRVDHAFVLFEEHDGIYAFLVEKQYADSMAFTMLARGEVEGYDKVYSTTFPRQIAVYSRNESQA